MALRHTTREDYEQRLLRAQQLLEARLDSEISPAELARAASFSLHHFHRIFRAQLGESVMQRVRRLRLERAARRVRDSGARLIEVALEAGYESHEAFTRAFSEHFGVAPSDYRARPAAPREVLTNGPRVPVEVRTCAAVPVAFMRHHGSYDTVGETFGRLAAWAAEHALLRDGVLYGLCPDDAEVTPTEHLRFDAAVLLDRALPPTAGLGVAEVPAGTYAVGVHVGPYDRLRETYLDVIGRWFPTSGYEPAPEPIVEHYLNDPSRIPADELRTEVRVRIAD